MPRAIDWTHYDQLKAQGLGDQAIARQWGIPWGTIHWENQKRAGQAGPMLPIPEHHETPQGATSRVPARVPRQESIEPQRGTPSGTPEGTPKES
jgi:hypothetical protein